MGANAYDTVLDEYDPGARPWSSLADATVRHAQGVMQPCPVGGLSRSYRR